MNNNQQSNISVPHPLGAIYGGVSESVQKVSDFIGANPDITPKKMQEVNRQLAAIIESVNAIGEANQALDYAKTILDRELAATGSSQSVPVNNAGGMPTFSSFQDIVASQWQ